METISSPESDDARPENNDVQSDIDILFADIPLNTWMPPEKAQDIITHKLHLTERVATYLFTGTGSNVVEFIRGEDFFDPGHIPESLNGKKVYVLHGNTCPIVFYQTKLGVAYVQIADLK